jgi:NAD(P) transhydrogenase subunit beta
MSANQVALWYLVASVCFILALKGLSHPSTARRGNVFGIVGMAIAVLVTFALVYSHTRNVGWILAGIAVGGAIGAVIARRVQMTQMPELVAAFHSLVGMAAVLIAIAAVESPAAFGLPVPLPTGNMLELFIGTFIGAITFSGSVIAFGKLSGRIRSAPVVYPGQHWINLVLAIFVGYHVVWSVTPALHTPLMSVTNAISGIILVGAMLVLGHAEGTLETTLGLIAVVLATINVVGGFVVTDRMLEMFKGRKAPAKASQPAGESK